ncbi:Transposon Tf2-8 polyprotein [Labeo rohita]|uniref:Gypsy retrotransposon integrase-like protein 1 n=1 Tax=Labeo rohita TaxID=84645 RepID=A0ABQ8M910_LABRO|nr:Transposon Tf2-8 polyprotein [Labeo rohita]
MTGPRRQHNRHAGVHLIHQHKPHHRRLRPTGPRHLNSNYTHLISFATPYKMDTLPVIVCLVSSSHQTALLPVWIFPSCWTVFYVSCDHQDQTDTHTTMSTETPAASDQFSELVNAFKAALIPPAPPAASGSPMAVPAKYAGEAAECSGFLLQVNLYIQMQPQQFPTERTKVAFLTSLLTGKALKWAEAIWSSNNPITNSYEQFVSHFSEVFRTATDTLSTSDQLFRLRQGSSSIHDYTLQFRTLAAASGWNEVSLLGAYRQGLNPEIRSAMAIYEDSIGLEAFLLRTTRVSQQLAACQPPITAPPAASVAASPPVPEPMQVDSTRLTRTERNRRISLGLCLYCGQSGHILRTCPVRPPRPMLCWETSDVTRWSKHCFIHCLSGVPPHHVTSVPLASTLVESPETLGTQEIPAEYRAFQDVFSKQAATKLPPHRPWDCAIDLLPGAQLPKGKIYPLSIPERQAMEAYITEALDQGFIRPSTSPAASSFFFVGKKDGGLRPCIDYRTLNSQIIQQPYPLPLVPAALEELRGSQVFTKLDLRSAYNLVRIREGDEWKTAFVTPTGHYEYLVMPYGLSISPSVFQTFMNEVFREFLHQFVIVYIDDILIYSRNMAEHRQHVQQVLHKLRQYQLYLKLEKCEFHQSSVYFLGYNISAEGVHMDQKKIDAILNWPPPSNVKELQRFLGFANFYRRFIQGYSSITAPLTSLLRGKPKHLTWNPAAHEAFQHLKHLFSTAPLLRHPDPGLPFTVEVDASTAGVGAVLSQAAGDPAILHPCAFYSHKLSPAEQNYDVGNRELLAIKLALEEWRHWLEGARHPITYRPGSKNIPADALSRLSSPEPSTDLEPIIPSHLFVSPIIWDINQDIRRATLQEPAPPDCPEGKIYVPGSLRQRLLGTVHQSPGSGHPGSKRTFSLLQSRYWWSSMRRDSIRYVQSCSVCARSNSLRMSPAGLLVPLPIPERPWSHLGVDFITDLPRSDGHTCILVAVDRFSKMCKLIPLSGLPTAMEAAEHLFNQVFRQFGIPEEIVSDRGPQFISHVWKAFFKLLGVSVNLSSGYHPQTNGQTERKIQELGRYLRAYCQEDQHSWSRFLPWAEYAQNSLRLDSTGLTPFQCVLGYQPPLFPWTEEPSNVPAVDYWFRESERVWDSAHHHLQRAICRNKRFADARRRTAPRYQPGDSVWLSTRDLRLRLPCRKLSPRYIGPFKILRQLNDVTFQLQLPPRYRIHPTFHVSLLKPHFPSATETPGAEAGAPPPEILDQPSVYTVNQILDSRRRGGRLEYLIDWEGYGPEERSWVPRDDVLDPSLLTDFHRNHPERPAPRGRGHPRRRVRASGAAPGGGGSVRRSPHPPAQATSQEAPPNRSTSHQTALLPVWIFPSCWTVFYVSCNVIVGPKRKVEELSFSLPDLTFFLEKLKAVIAQRLHLIITNMVWREIAREHGGFNSSKLITLGSPLKLITDQR